MKRKLLFFILSLCIIFSQLPVIPAEATTTIQIGDYIQIGKYYDEPILWRCVDVDQNGPLMLSDKIITIRPFDALGIHKYLDGTIQPDLYDRRKHYGSNLWETSNLRWWLNSTATAGNVTWPDGCPPTIENTLNGYNAYDAEKGFLADGNFTVSERNVIKSVTQKSLINGIELFGIRAGGKTAHDYNKDISTVAQNYDTAYFHNVTDNMFLLDVKQINKVYQNNVILGTSYFIGQPTQKAVEYSNYKDDIDSAYGKNMRTWLRSPEGNYNYPQAVRVVYADGQVSEADAYNSRLGVRPAFYLNLSTIDFKSGTDGSYENPYRPDIVDSVKEDPTITSWPSIAPITYGQPLDDVMSGGIAYTPGIFAIEDGAIAPDAGTYTKMMAFTPADTNTYKTVTQNVILTINKADQIAPAIATLKNATSVTVAPVSGAEYGIKPKNSLDMVVYGSGNVFTGLTPATQYTVYIRMAATQNYNASLESSTDVTTNLTDIDLITSITLNAPSNLIQTHGETSAVNFMATATPTGSVDTNTIEWYVNGAKQAITGTSFSYIPENIGSYVVSTKVANNTFAKSDIKTITVAAAGDQFLFSDSVFGLVGDAYQPITIMVMMNNVDYLKGIQATFNYDPVALTCINASKIVNGFGNYTFSSYIKDESGNVTVIGINDFEYNPLNPTTFWNQDDPAGSSMPAAFGFVQLTFKVKPGAVAGTYPITVTDYTAAKQGATIIPLGQPRMGSVTLTESVKTDPSVVWPSVSEITYGQSFANAISGGSANVAGTFKIVDETFVPNASTTPYTKIITFMPSDTLRYNTITQNADIIVNKAEQIKPYITVLKTAKYLTITPIAGAEYGLKLKSSSDVVAYGSDNVFTGLTPTTEYTVYIRMAATQNDHASPEASTDITTDVDGFELITSVKLNTPHNLQQTYSGMSAVHLKATVSPTDDVDLSTIEWYVNGVRQYVTGTGFLYKPVDVGNYVVSVKVSNNASAIVDAKTITVITVGEQYLLSNSEFGSVGDTNAPIIIMVTMNNVDYLKGIQATFNYDKNALTCTAASKIDYGFGNSIFVKNIDDENGYVTVQGANQFAYNWLEPTTFWNQDDPENPVMPVTFGLVKLTFKVRPGAQAGTYPITASDIKAVISGNIATSIDPPQMGSITLTLPDRTAPNILSWPTVNAITYGQTFANAITGGLADVPGTFAIEDATGVPDASETPYTKVVTFIPNDMLHNSPVTQTFDVIVNKADRVPTISATRTSNYVKIEYVEDAEYGLKLKGSPNAVEYQSYNGFYNLIPNTTYTAYIRMPTTQNYNASPEVYADVTTYATEPALITSVSLNTPDNLNQAVGSISAINFTATATPTDNVELNTIRWLVDGFTQDTIGSSFTYMPKGTGTHVISVRVIGNQHATVDSKTVTVNADDVQFLCSNSASVPAGDTTTPITIMVAMNNVDYIKGIQATFNFDPNALALSYVTKVTNGFGNMIFSKAIYNDAGLTNVLLTNAQAYNPNDKTTWWIYDEENDIYSMPSTLAIVKLIFKAKAGAVSGTYPITATNVIAAGKSGISIPLAAPVMGSITIAGASKEDPMITLWPTTNTMTYGQTFANAMSGGTANVPGIFSIQDDVVVPDAGTYTKTMTFTPTDTTTYNTVTKDVVVTVEKATPLILNWPTVNVITYGQTFGDAISEGGANVPGVFAISNASSAPEAGSYSNQVVTFTPVDTANYSTVSSFVKVTVNKLDPSVTWPEVNPKIYSPTLILANIILPAGFAWVNPTTSLSTGTTSYPIRYTPADLANYNTMTNDITVTVNKAIPSPPPLTVASKTETSITLTPVAGAVYGLKEVGAGEAVVYGSDNEFNGLTSNTTYIAYIKLFATANYNESPETNLIVKTNSSVNDDVNDDVNDLGDEDIILTPIDEIANPAAGQDLNNIKGNITLPSAGARGSAITWSSDRPNVIKSNGRVIRPANLDGDATVILTATLEKNGAERIKQFNLTVKALPAPPSMTFAKFNAQVPTIAIKGPSDVAVDASGNIWVTDYNNNRVVKFGPSGTLLKIYGSAGSGVGQFNKPNSIAIAADGSVFVADTYNHRIVKFNDANNNGIISAAEWTVWGTATAGGGVSQFNRPSGLVVKGNKVYVTDTLNYRVIVFDATIPGDWHTFGSYGKDDNQLFFAMDIAVDVIGDVWVADTYNNAIKRFSEDGTFIIKYAAASPYGVAVDAVGNVYASERSAGTIKCVNNTKTFAGKGTLTNQFVNPTGMTVDLAGNMWIVDVTASVVKQAVMQ